MRPPVYCLEREYGMLGTGRRIPPHGLEFSRDGHPRRNACERRVDEEVNVLFVVYPVQVKYMRMIDGHIRGNQTVKRCMHGVCHCLALLVHFISDFLAFAIGLCEIITADFATPRLDDKGGAFWPAGSALFLLQAHGQMAGQGIAA